MSKESRKERKLRKQEEKQKQQQNQNLKIDDMSNDPMMDAARGFGVAQDDTIRPAINLTKKEQKKLKQEFKIQKKAIKAEQRATKAKMKTVEAKQKKSTKSISQQLKERDKAIGDRTRASRNKRKNANNVVDLIGYQRMFEDGICEVEEGVFSQTLTFPDISYQSARDDHQKDIFNTMCSIYDYFDTSVALQFNLVNKQLRTDQIGTRTFFNVEQQQTETAREDAKTFNEILNRKMKEGISNIQRNRYITYAIAAPSLEAAYPKLSRIRTDVSAFFNKIGCNCRRVEGKERLELIYNILNPEQKFNFDYNRLTLSSGLTTKDYVSPSVLDFKPDGDNSCFKSDDKWCQVLCFSKFGSELNDRVISDLVDLPIPLQLSWYAQPWDRSKAIQFVKMRAGWVDKEIVDEQRRSASKGQDFTVLSSEIKYTEAGIQELLDDILNKNQNLYTFTGLVYIYADSREELDERVLQVISTARVQSITISSLSYRQKEGLNSVLPLANNYVDISRCFTTAQISVFMPFATQELDDEGGNYAGQNRNSNNLVIVNRKKLASPVGFICGKTGSGKSFFVKQEIEGTILNNPNDQIIVFDRAGEYNLLGEHHNGNIFRFSPNSDVYLNPFDISQDENQTRDAQILNKIDAMIAQASAAASQAGVGLTDEEQSIIARCVELAFAKADKTREDKVPLLEDFYTVLLEQAEDAATMLALRYERFVSGSQAFFNHQSNVNWNNRLIEINIKELPDNMLIFCLITMCEAARNQMYHNAESGKRTWIYIEEIQSMFKYPDVLGYFSRFANEARKFGGLLTGITQNSISMLNNEQARPIVLNADFIMLLKQSPVDRNAWNDLLGLSIQETGFIDESTDKGCGLLVAGANRIPIVGDFPKHNQLYDLFSTDPNEEEEKKIKEELKRKSIAIQQAKEKQLNDTGSNYFEKLKEKKEKEIEISGRIEQEAKKRERELKEKKMAEISGVTSRPSPESVNTLKRKAETLKKAETLQVAEELEAIEEAKQAPDKVTNFMTPPVQNMQQPISLQNMPMQGQGFGQNMQIPGQPMPYYNAQGQVIYPNMPYGNMNMQNYPNSPGGVSVDNMGFPQFNQSATDFSNAKQHENSVSQGNAALERLKEAQSSSNQEILENQRINGINLAEALPTFDPE